MITLDDLDRISGWCPTDLCRLLYQMAGQIPADQAIIELGVWRGRTACHLAAGALTGLGAHVYGVDLWDLGGQSRQPQVDPTRLRLDAYATVRDLGLTNLSLVWDSAVGFAAKYAGPPVGLLFVDAGHREDEVLADVTAWTPHLAEGATVVFDDHNDQFPGVVTAVERLRQQEIIAEPVLRRSANGGSTFAITRAVRYG